MNDLVINFLYDKEKIVWWIIKEWYMFYLYIKYLMFSIFYKL
jgi:hypothetical protein